ncbi:MAG: hypothetical protein ACI9BD_000867 [Candidatus Marinamargulisbacteria bacterium]|jgi:hypothetical protein
MFMNMKKLGLACLGVFVFVFAFDFIVHGNMLKGLYEATASAWRPMDEHDMRFMMASQLLFAVFLTYFFVKLGKTGMSDGIMYGLAIGTVLGAVQLGTYCYLPIPLSLTLAWVAAAVVKSVGCGAIAAKIYKA